MIWKCRFYCGLHHAWTTLIINVTMTHGVNLRMATFSQNMHNRSMNRNNISGVKGVCWHKRHGKWYAQIMHAGKTYSIGLFDNIEDAKIAVETARASLHKEFACSGGKNDQVAR